MLQILLHRSGARSLACEVDGDSGASVSEGVLNLLADNMHRMGSFTLKGSPILLQKCILRAAPKLESLMLIGVEPLPPQLFDGRAGRLRNLALHNFQSLPLNRAFSAITHLSIEGDMTHRRIRVHDLFSAFPRLKSLSAASPLANPYWEMRISAVLAFYDIVSSWPRTTIPVPPEAFKSEEEFLNFESAVWEAYATVYVTYLYREAPIPLVHPDDVSALGYNLL
ncbi:hypothetical protein AURDEDRAFT_171925 [Auricularia subglabra TFB-10046 SS5]|nr:hypothetical protein AURDEDRAFT_171925 [Auricularia subglabra TFB-10046 SS5]